MRHKEGRRIEYRNNKIQSLPGWLGRTFTIIAERLNNKKENNELDGLSDHLLNDLGFARDGQPLQWSSFSPGLTESDCYTLSGKERVSCLQNLAELPKSCCH